MNSMYPIIRHYFIGFISLLSILFFLVYIFFISDKNKFHKNYNIYKLYLSNVDNITNKTPVTFLGYKVGSVKKVYLDEDNNPIVVLYIKKNIKIPTDSSIIKKEDGFLGKKLLQLNLGIEDTILNNKDIIYNGSSGIALVDLIPLMLNYFSNKIKGK